MSEYRKVQDGVEMKVVDDGRIHVYRHADGAFTVAEGGVWVSGIFDSEEGAIEAARAVIGGEDE